MAKDFTNKLIHSGAAEARSSVMKLAGDVSTWWAALDPGLPQPQESTEKSARSPQARSQTSTAVTRPFMALPLYGGVVLGNLSGGFSGFWALNSGLAQPQDREISPHPPGKSLAIHSYFRCLSGIWRIFICVRSVFSILFDPWILPWPKGSPQKHNPGKV